MLGWLLLILFVFLALGALPTWPWSRTWGYVPSGLFGALMIAVVVLLVVGLL